jgi:hypothetical protein
VAELEVFAMVTLFEFTPESSVSTCVVAVILISLVVNELFATTVVGGVLFGDKTKMGFKFPEDLGTEVGIPGVVALIRCREKPIFLEEGSLTVEFDRERACGCVPKKKENC